MDVRQFVTVDVFTRQQFAGTRSPWCSMPRGCRASRCRRSPPSSTCRRRRSCCCSADAAPYRTGCASSRRAPRCCSPGHPNVGTAFVLGAAARAMAARSRRPAVCSRKAAAGADRSPQGRRHCFGARLAAPQRLAIGTSSRRVRRRGLRPSPDAIALAAHAPCIASCGAAFIVAELGDRAALAAATPRTDEFTRHFARRQFDLLLYVRGDGTEADIYCRMFAPLQGIAEDPRHRLGRRGAGRTAGVAAPRAGAYAVAQDLAGHRNWPSQPARRHRPQDRRSGRRDHRRGPLRGRDERDDRSRGVTRTAVGRIRILPDRDRRSSTARRRW